MNDRSSAKVEVLSDRYGSQFDRAFEAGWLPAGQIDNFFGRHEIRQQKIPELFKSGSSYSAAYTATKLDFDTKRWSKFHLRTAACRGLVLKVACWLSFSEVSVGTSDRKLILSMIDRIEAAVRGQLMSLGKHHLDESPTPHRLPPPLKDLNLDKQSLEKSITDLRTAASKLEKNVRDAGVAHGVLDGKNSVRNVAQTAIDSGRILRGVESIRSHLVRTGTSSTKRTATSDPWGVGEPYSNYFRMSYPEVRDAAQIATHRKPDADAIVSTWLAQRYLFQNRPSTVQFVGRDFGARHFKDFDAVLDVGRVHDPERCIFDHKPPAFDHRNQHCATSLVRNHLSKLGHTVAHLEELVQVVHDGDAATRRSRSIAYAQSRKTGLHAIIHQARSVATNDPVLYRAIALVLDARFERSSAVDCFDRRSSIRRGPRQSTRSRRTPGHAED